MKRLLLAAGQGDAATQFNLGVFYDNRLDDNHYPIAGNRAQAMKWLVLAADQGLPRAQVKLAEMYADESETPMDSVRACKWLLLAAENLSGIRRDRVQAALARIAALMTPAQIAEARRLARDWKLNPQINDAVASSANILAAKVSRTAAVVPAAHGQAGSSSP